jgi:hypothetical protein
VKKLGEQPDDFSLYAFVAAIAFRDAAYAAVKAHGVNGLARSNLIAAMKTLTAFTADGMSLSRMWRASANSAATGRGVVFVRAHDATCRASASLVSPTNSDERRSMSSSSSMRPR